MRAITRRRAYFTLMAVCIALILVAWNLVRLWSTKAAVVMSVVAAVIPPIAAIVANYGALREPGPERRGTERREDEDEDWPDG